MIPETTRLVSIDALRGMAAIAVVLFHALGSMPWDRAAQFPQSLSGAVDLALSFGFAGVWLFFVISGFCIHLSWAKQASTDPAPKVTFIAFWKRRIRRLYPAYLVALAMYLVFEVSTGDLRITEFFFYDLGMHLAMLHNLDSRTVYSINNVFWTLAIEEQLYLMYFLLLAMRTRWGWHRTLLCCLLVRCGWHVLCFGCYRLLGIGIPVAESAAPHWFGWALGAVSAEAAVGLIALPKWCRSAVLGGSTLCLAAGLCYADRLMDPYSLFHDIYGLVIHPIWAAGFFIVVNATVGAELRLGAGKPLVSMLIRPAAIIGVFSYSLYLTHEFVLGAGQWWIRGLPEVSRHAMTLAVVPMCVAFAWMFYQLFERPFLSRGPSANRQVSHVGVLAASAVSPRLDPT